MIRALTLVAFLSMAVGVLAEECPLCASDKSDEMTCIFNGKDLTGWDGDPRLWSVKDGVIYGETTPEKAAQGNTFLIWKDGVLKDFELRLSFQVSSQNNSGIQYRSKHITEGVRNAWVVRGYQHEIRNSDTLSSVAGFIYEEGGKRGRMCLVGEKAVWGEDGKKTTAEEPLVTAEEFAELFKVDDWNDVVIIGKGNRLQHYMNGVLILDCTDNFSERALSEGVLALQLHAGSPMWCKYKHVRVKDLK